MGLSSVQPLPIDPTPTMVSPSMGHEGKHCWQLSKRNQVVDSIGVSASVPSKDLAVSGAVKTGGTKYVLDDRS